MPTGSVVDAVTTGNFWWAMPTLLTSRDQTFHFPHRLGQADHDGSGDDAVPDIQLAHFVDRRDRANVAIGQAMAGVQKHFLIEHNGGGLLEDSKFSSLGFARRGQGVPARVQLDGVGPELPADDDLRRIGVEEQGDDDPRLLEPPDHLADAVRVADNVQPALGRDLFAPLGHERGLLRPRAAGDLDDLVLAGHLQVELDGHALAQQRQVAILDVAPVFAEMDRNAVGQCRTYLCGHPGGTVHKPEDIYNTIKEAAK